MSAPPVLWIHRVLWITLPFTVGDSLGAELAGRTTSVQVVAAAMAWAGWGAALVAAVVPLPLSLTALRLLTPAAAGLAAWCTATGPLRAIDVAGLATAVLSARLACSAPVADWCVDGASYGDERRFLLRAPSSFVVGPMPVAATVAVVGVAAGPMLLAARQWLAGAAVLVVGPLAAMVAVRSFHALTRRWLVFVPAGVTVVDHLALADPVLLSSRHLRSIAPAVEGTDALDLSQQALGLAIEVALDEAVELTRRTGAEDAQVESATAVIVSPASPAAVLREAERRAMPPARTTSPS